MQTNTCILDNRNVTLFTFINAQIMTENKALAAVPREAACTQSQAAAQPVALKQR